jgi:hypothetical protein
MRATPCAVQQLALVRVTPHGPRCMVCCMACAVQVLELEPGNAWASKVVRELGPQVAERQEKVKEEMLGAL